MYIAVPLIWGSPEPILMLIDIPAHTNFNKSMLCMVQLVHAQLQCRKVVSSSKFT